MALTYSETKTNLDRIAAKIEASRKGIDRARQEMVTAETTLSAIQTEFSGFMTELTAAVAANPNDPAWQAAGAEKDHMISDFQALKARAIALKAAYDGV